GRSMQVAVIDAEGKERQSFKLPFGAKLKVDDKAKITRGDRIAEWDPYSTPIITEVKGRVRFEDLIDNVSARDEIDESTGISSKHVIDWRSTSKGSDLRPAVVIIDEKKNKPVKLQSGGEARYLLPVGAILSVNDGDEAAPGQDLARITTGGAKTRDIT